MKIDLAEIKEIIEFRKVLHRNPELSGKEKNTSLRIIHFIKQYNPDKIIENIGGHGVIAVFKGETSGKKIMFRADIDALPIHEESILEYRSINKNSAHLCGHDGHTAILVNLIRLFSKNRPSKGDVIFLFQPSEENGEGAKKVLEDIHFETPDFIFAIHNLPGFTENHFILKQGTFASASKGMIIKLSGKTSHAAEPEKGISPALAMAELVTFFTDLNSMDNLFSDFVLTTVVHARLGEIAFGITPGYAEVMITIRSFSDSDMKELIKYSELKVTGISQKYKIQSEISFVDEFPATVNNPECISQLISLCNENNFQYKILENPFKWSEDFGQFTSVIPGAMIGIGSGDNHPNLHNPLYDFPDSIIPLASEYLFNVYTKFQEL